MTRPLPAEFALAAACCRWPPSSAREAAIAAAADRSIDWARFERVVTHHRIVPLVHDGLRRAGVQLPGPLAARLAAAATAATARALAMARETVRLHDRFGAAGIPMISVKGASLAVLAYRELGMKQAYDVDLVTSPEYVRAARTLLEELGYALDPPLELSAFERFVGFSKNCVFHHPGLGIPVELHWHLIDNPRLLPGIGLDSSMQEVGIGGARVPTLARAGLFAFLCVHGTSHSWSRLKWLADVGAYLADDNAGRIEDLYRAAVGLGAGRAPAVTLLLCEQLLGAVLPAGLAAELRADGINVSLAESALRCMTWRRGEAEIPYLSAPTLRILLTSFFLAPGTAYFLDELKLKWNSPLDRSRWNFPRPFTFLYHVLRIPFWLGRWGKRCLNSAWQG